MWYTFKDITDRMHSWYETLFSLGLKSKKQVSQWIVTKKKQKLYPLRHLYNKTNIQFKLQKFNQQTLFKLNLLFTPKLHIWKLNFVMWLIRQWMRKSYVLIVWEVTELHTANRRIPQNIIENISICNKNEQGTQNKAKIETGYNDNNVKILEISLDVLQTVLTEVKSVINDRPITVISQDIRYQNPLARWNCLCCKYSFIKWTDYYTANCSTCPTWIMNS